MLTLKVKTGDSIAIGEIIVMVQHVRGKDQLRLSIDAPRNIDINHARAGGLLSNSIAPEGEILED